MGSKPRILGLDVGDKRIGVAISDPLGITASGLETINRRNSDYDLQTIKDIIDRHSIVEIVIGLPLNMNGSIGDQAIRTQSFGKRLAQYTNLPVIYEDERLSTVSAIRTLVAVGKKSGRNKGLKDKVAAAIILQKFLDKNSPQTGA